jgi:UDP-2,3-diacylglucosamine pyrophosphatase LpxH
MNIIVVSDCHIGSKFFVNGAFEQFLKRLPSDHTLILNGDVIDNFYRRLQPSHQKILDLIKHLSFQQKIIWIMGNHDDGYLPDQLGHVDFKRSYSVGRRLLITHGHDFDEIMYRNQWFMKTFKLMHDIRVKLGSKPVHVAEYAKKWSYFYRILRTNVSKNAVRCAMENGYEAVACGHTHYAEDVILNGVRYINTGTWTEYPAYFIHVTDETILLKKANEYLVK